MIQKITILILLTFCSIALCHSQKYFNEGDVYEDLLIGGDGFETFFHESIFTVKNDTTINNIDYQIFEQKYDHLQVDNSTLFGDIDTISYEQNIVKAHYVRQEDQKIYIIKNSSESLIYDFQLEIGDLIPIVNKEVDSISTMQIGELSRKVFHADYVEYIEGIGFLAGFLKPTFLFNSHASGTLKCVSIENNFYSFYNMESFYHFDYEYKLKPCETVTSINIQSTNERVLVFPNPTEQNINIRGIEEDYDLIIYNINGQVLVKEKIYFDTEISLESFRPGFYYLKLINANTRITEKVLKL